MTVNRSGVLAFAWVAGMACAQTAAASITIPTVPIGHLGNAADPVTGYGAVSYAYNIGTGEVSNRQYAAFLNSVAKTDTNNLWNIGFDPNAGLGGGISRSGSPGNYSYTVSSGWEDLPAQSTSFWNAARFANWMHNGQPVGLQGAGTTEDGAYTLTPGGIAANSVTRNSGWQWAVTSEDEWYKAAYFQPAAQGGDVDNYWLYGTSSNTITTAVANWGGVVGDYTATGTYPANFFGVYDMAGNVREWNEAIIGANRGVRDGYYNSNSLPMRATTRSSGPAGSAILANGFRLVQIPAPSSGAILGLTALMASRRRR
jgi:formylglycine-generating enzyme required for sulfatase activity